MNNDNNDQTLKDLDDDFSDLILIPPPGGSPIGVVGPSGGTPVAPAPVTRIQFKIREEVTAGRNSREILEVLKQTFANVDFEIIKNVVENFFKPQPKNPSASQIADSYLMSQLPHKNWQGVMHVWNGKFYEALSKDQFQFRVVSFLKNNPLTADLITKRFITDVILVLMSDCHIPPSTMPGSWLEVEALGGLPSDKPENFIGPVICCQNVNVDFGRYLLNPNDATFPQTPDLFVTNVIGANFDPNAKSEKFESFLAKVQPDTSVQQLLKEKIGYLTIPDTSIHAIFYNRSIGGAGTSTFAYILQLLLGERNYSTVPLERFDDLAAISPIAGKLANFSGDVGELNRDICGSLKRISAGDEIQVKKLYLDPIQIKPFARILIFTNTELHLQDPSAGLFRRLIRVDWKNAIKTEDQDRQIMTAGYWKDELSGILNTALAGLAALKQRGYFDLPESVKAANETFRTDKNPIREILSDYVIETGEEEKAKPLPCSELYQRYYHAFEQAGNTNKPATAQFLAQNVKLMFPKAEKSKNLQTVEVLDFEGKKIKRRDRVWTGIRFKTDAELDGAK